MEKLKILTSGFKVTDCAQRAQLREGKERPDAFKAIAECMLSGHFHICSGCSDVYVRPIAVEFYYHEEEGDIHDWIVYHRDTDSSPKPLIPTGILHNHVSGIDLTFEHENNGKVRASALIREFRIINCSNVQKEAMDAFNVKVDENDKRSTYTYAALFSQFSPLDGFTVIWEDSKYNLREENIDWTQRDNVHLYEDTPREGNKPKLEKLSALDGKPWKARNTEFDTKK